MSNMAQLLGFGIATLALLALAEAAPEFAAVTMGVIVLGALVADPTSLNSLTSLFKTGTGA